MGFSGQPTAVEEPEVNGFFGVMMNETFDRSEDVDLDIQFFEQLAMEALFKCFMRLPFSAWKFPEPAQVRLWVALSDEQLTVAEHHACRDVNNG